MLAAVSAPAATPRPSSTVIVLAEARDADGPFSLLLLERHGSIAFPGATAFPGGVVDAGDADAPGARLPAAQRWAPPGEGERPPEGLATWVAALRELFEEVGILLATRDGRLLEGPLAPELAALRPRVAAGESFAGVLASAGLVPATDALFSFARWITPGTNPRRWDTRFLVARFPAGQEPVADGTETVSGTWMSPRAARDAYEAGRRCRERVAREERGHHLRRRQEACEQRLEVARAGSRAEEQEPELEVNPRLVRGDEGRRPRGVAGLVAELVGQPGRAVRGALDHGLAAHERHVREEMVGVDGAEGGERATHGQEAALEAGQRVQEGEELEHRERHQDRHGDGQDERPPRRLARHGGAGEVAVVQHPERERDGEVVEEAVVGGGEDGDLHGDHAGEDGRPQPARPPDEERQAELGPVDEGAARPVCPERHLVRPPADPGGERRGLVVARHGGEVAPGRVAEQELRRARLDVDADEEPEHQEDGERMGRRRGARPEATRRDEKRAHGGLEEQVVPLEGEEVLPHGDEREIERPEERQAVARRQVEDEAQAQHRARDPGGAERAVARAEPEDGRRVEEPARGPQVVARREQALLADEEGRLHEQ